MDIRAGKITNVFSKDDVQKIINALSKVEEQAHTEDKIYTNGFRKTDQVYPFIKKMVIDRITSIIDFSFGELTVGMQLKSRKPFGIHTDYFKEDDMGGGMAWLVPLYILGSSTETYTVIFDQHSTEFSQIPEYIKSNPAKPQCNSREIWHEIPDSPAPDIADYFSVKLLGNWGVGDVIYWDRRLFHSSDEFRAKGVMEKSALVMFSHC
jgi:hypothetical protein